jgi:hypothetical protein
VIKSWQEKEPWHNRSRLSTRAQANTTMLKRWSKE